MAFGAPELAAQASVLRTEVRLAFEQCRSSQTEGSGRAVEHVTGPSSEYFISADRLSGQSPNHEAKCASVFQGLMSNPTSLMTVCATITSMPSMRVNPLP